MEPHVLGNPRPSWGVWECLGGSGDIKKVNWQFDQCNLMALNSYIGHDKSIEFVICVANVQDPGK